MPMVTTTSTIFIKIDEKRMDHLLRVDEFDIYLPTYIIGQYLNRIDLFIYLHTHTGIDIITYHEVRPICDL